MHGKITATLTSNFYVRYTDGVHKWFKAILFMQLGHIRVSRRVFKTASEALKYHDRFIQRMRRK
jgi:hypothetical protein